MTDNSATSDHHALQLELQRRLSRGLEVLASYTFSHSIDSSSTDAFANYLSTPGAFANPNIDRGDSDFDIRHAFTTFDVQVAAGRIGQDGPRDSGRMVAEQFCFCRTAPPDDVIDAQFEAAGTALTSVRTSCPGLPVVPYGAGYPDAEDLNCWHRFRTAVIAPVLTPFCVPVLAAADTGA